MAHPFVVCMFSSKRSLVLNFYCCLIFTTKGLILDWVGSFTLLFVVLSLITYIDGIFVFCAVL